MATAEEIVKLRSLLGEDVPEGGTEDDTLFADEELASYVDDTPSMERAAYEGWRVKAARLANLVDYTEGNSARKLSQALSNAEKMVKIFQRSAIGSTEGRA